MRILDIQNEITLEGDFHEEFGYLGYAEEEVSTINATSDRLEGTVALTGSYGNFSYGYQKDFVEPGQTTATAATDYYVIDQIGLAYAVNDALSISYNIMEEQAHRQESNNTFKQETDAISLGYTVGGLTLGFQDAQTDNANNVLNAKDDTRTISIKAAF